MVAFKGPLYSKISFGIVAVLGVIDSYELHYPEIFVSYIIIENAVKS